MDILTNADEEVLLANSEDNFQISIDFKTLNYDTEISIGKTNKKTFKGKDQISSKIGLIKKPLDRISQCGHSLSLRLFKYSK